MISTESTPAMRPSASTTGRVAGLGLEQIREGVAHHVVEIQHRVRTRIGASRDGLAEQVGVGEPAQRPALGVDDQRVGDLGAPSSFARTSDVA